LFSCHFNEVDRVGSNEKSQQYVISSIHESKGLEYDTVILLNALDNTYFFDGPQYEARCKLFVGASRARQNLFIFEHHYHFTNGLLRMKICSIVLISSVRVKSLDLWKEIVEITFED